LFVGQGEQTPYYDAENKPRQQEKKKRRKKRGRYKLMSRLQIWKREL
jgi:hypothetical protein